MFQLHINRVIETSGPTQACIAPPARFHVQARAARSHVAHPFRCEVRDSAMPTRFHIA